MAITCLMLVSGGPEAAQKIWIDSDPTCSGIKTDDVDDCWALLLAIAASELDVIAISTVFGNGSGEQSYQAAREIVGSFAISDQMPVHRGANKPLGNQNGDVNQASVAMANALLVEPLTVVALGPLTNIADLISNRPSLIGNIKKIIAVAGKRPQEGLGFYPGRSRIFHLHDLNFRKDVDAFEVILRSQVPIILVPYEVAEKIRIEANDLARLETGGTASQWIAEISKPWLNFWQTNLKSEGFFPFDSLAIGRLISPHSFTCEKIPIRIQQNTARFTSTRDDLLVSHDYQDALSAEYCYGVDESFKRTLIERLKDISFSKD